MMKKISLCLLFCLAFGVSTFAQEAEKETRICGTHEHHLNLVKTNPQYAAKQKELEQKTRKLIEQRKFTRASSEVITIPVVFHVLYKTAAENISDEQIYSQLQVLNEDFRFRNEADIHPFFEHLAGDARIEFCLAKRTPEGLSTTGITRTATAVSQFPYAIEQEMKHTSTGGKDAWDRDRYLNIWVCNLNYQQVLGFATYPGGPAETDGVVLDYRVVGKGSYGLLQNYAQGRTATHEVGHWLHLAHIWGDAPCGDDLVDDTPTQADKNFQCPSFPHVSCGNTSDMYMNYMDYTYDQCKHMFSKGQIERMHAALILGRSSILTSDACIPTDTYCKDTMVFRIPSAELSDGSGAQPYKENSDCKWLIAPKGATSITIELKELELEEGIDFLTLYDGPDATYPVLALLTGSTLPATLTSTSDSVFIRFRTDHQLNAAGWKLLYTSNYEHTTTACQDTVTYTGITGHVEDGSGSLNYGAKLNCVYEIKPPGAHQIVIKFSAFDTEKYYDLVEIYFPSYAYPVRQLSGSVLPDSIVLPIGHVFVKFVSDEAIHRTGWAFDYRADSSTYCSEQSHYTLPSATITDGSGNKDYWNRESCFYYIQPDGDSPVTLHFNEFDLETDYDYLYVYDGLDPHATPIATYTGKTVPADLTLPSGKGILHFATDNFTTAKGWSLTYAVTTSVEESLSSNKLALYPNPATHQLFISGLKAEKIDYAIVNSLGEKMIQSETSTGIIDITVLQPGLYVIELLHNNHIIRNNFLKLSN